MAKLNHPQIPSTKIPTIGVAKKEIALGNTYLKAMGIEPGAITPKERMELAEKMKEYLQYGNSREEQLYKNFKSIAMARQELAKQRVGWRETKKSLRKAK